MTPPFGTVASGDTGNTSRNVARVKLGRALLAYLLQHELPAALRGSEINSIVLQALAAVDAVIEARLSGSTSQKEQSP